MTICTLICSETSNDTFIICNVLKLLMINSLNFHLKKSVQASGETIYLFSQRKFVLVSARCLEVITTRGHAQLNRLSADSDRSRSERLWISVKNIALFPKSSWGLPVSYRPLLYNGFAFHTIALLDFLGKVKEAVQNLIHATLSPSLSFKHLLNISHPCGTFVTTKDHCR